jgi:hypothetical protein
MGPAELKWASECFPLEGEYTEPQAKFNGNYLRPRFVRILPFSGGFWRTAYKGIALTSERKRRDPYPRGKHSEHVEMGSYEFRYRS